MFKRLLSALIGLALSVAPALLPAPAFALSTALLTPGLSPSAPVVISRNNQIVERTRITVNTGVACVYNNGFSGVTYRNSICHHYGPSDGGASANANGRGYEGTTNNNLTISNVRFYNDRYAAAGANAYENIIHIYVDTATTVSISNVYGTNGSSGIILRTVTNPTIRNVRFDNMRGPFPKGQAFQCANCVNPVLSNFFFWQDNDVAWSEDIINIGYDGTSGGTGGAFSNGLIIGVNSPSGAGVLFEGATQPTLANVDVLGWNNQGASQEGSSAAGASSTGTSFTSVRVRDSSLYSRGTQNSALTSSTTINPTTNGTDDQSCDPNGCGGGGTSFTYSTGAGKAFVVGTGAGLTAGKTVIVNTNNYTNGAPDAIALGTVTTYNSGTGALVLNISSIISGSATVSASNQITEVTLFAVSANNAATTWISPLSQNPGNSPIRAEGNVGGQYLEGRPYAYVTTNLYLRITAINGNSSNTSFTMRQVATSGSLAFGSFDNITTGSSFVSCQYFNLAAPGNTLFDPATVTGTNDITSVDFVPRPPVQPSVPFGSFFLAFWAVRSRRHDNDNTSEARKAA